MQKLNKKTQPIVANLSLKKEVAHELAEELNINENSIDLTSDIFIKYAIVSLELQLYGSLIPYDDLEYYNLLVKQKAQFKNELQAKI